MNIGFIGCGNMASSLISGILTSSKFDKKQVIASATKIETLIKAQEKFGIEVTLDNRVVTQKSDIIIIAVKPHLYSKVISEISNQISNDKIVISIAPNITLDELLKMFARNVKIVRAMPNTPSAVMAGMTAICKNQLVTTRDLENIIELFSLFGSVEVILEQQMPAFIAVAGSSPAYIFMFIEALADGAVLHGIPYEQALKVASQAVFGSAKMILETNDHPARLKNNVCSAGGTTIEAVASLEKSGFRSSIIEAMRKCAEKAENM